MKIDSSTIAMSSQHSLVEKDVQEESVRAWDSQGSSAGVEADAQSVKAEISAQAKELYTSQQTQAAQSVSGDKSVFELSEGDKQRIRLIQTLLEALTGKRIKFVLPADIEGADTVGQESRGVKLFSTRMPFQNQSQSMLGWGLEYHSYQAHIEQEHTVFQAAGVVKTVDGKEINFSAELGMSRQFMSEQCVDIKAGDALRDPLVINFDSPAAQLTEKKIRFDLDSDGSTEEMSFLKPGSGFLALDRNNDGMVNNGQELFGPQSGNGFADLAQYDLDGNNWIDENDLIYDKLRIWTKDAQGNDQLFALGQKGVGAIYLGNGNTEFALKDSNNQLQGQVRSTGIFLKENGVVGTMQQVDLLV